jgi:hypothetical protein
MFQTAFLPPQRPPIVAEQAFKPPSGQCRREDCGKREKLFAYIFLYLNGYFVFPKELMCNCNGTTAVETRALPRL